MYDLAKRVQRQAAYSTPGEASILLAVRFLEKNARNLIFLSIGNPIDMREPDEYNQIELV